MESALKADIVSIIENGKDLTLATLREDGWPQATTVSYAGEGTAIYFGCGAQSQKARNLARDDRVSATINLDYGLWSEIRGLSIGGRAHRLTDPADMARAGAVFLKKFGPQIGQYVTDETPEMAMFQIVPAVISVLDYRKGFGHTDLVTAAELAACVAVPAAA